MREGTLMARVIDLNVQSPGQEGRSAKKDTLLYPTEGGGQKQNPACCPSDIAGGASQVHCLFIVRAPRRRNTVANQQSPGGIGCDFRSRIL